jgi:hypothetical protein
VGRGETVAAGDALAVCADIGTIAASKMMSMDPSKSNVFISDRAAAQSDESPTKKESSHIVAANVKQVAKCLK